MAASFYDTIHNAFPFNPTADQENAMQALATFLEDGDSERVFILKGYVGTGKTTLLAAMAAGLLDTQRRFFLLAPTRQAARLVRKQTSLPTSTLYAYLYQAGTNPKGEVAFTLRDDAPPKNSVIIVDQAALVPNRPDQSNDGHLNPNHVLADLITYLKRETSAKVIFVGDVAQLPSPEEDISAALYGPALTHQYGLAHTTIELRRVTQRASTIGPIVSATYLRDMIDKSTFKEQRLAVLKTGDIHLIDADGLLNSLKAAYAQHGEEDVCLICNTDRRAVRHNQRIRSNIFGLTAILTEGERVMVAQDYHHHPELQRLGIPFLGRGELLRVVSLGKIETRGDYTFQTIEIEFEQTNGETARLSVLANTGILLSQSAGFPQKDAQKLRSLRKKAYEHLSKEEAESGLATDPFLNALQLKYGYAITADKTRGGQWGHVFVDCENVFVSQNQSETHRWFYTAITRTFDQLTVIDFPDEWVRHDLPHEIEALIAESDDADSKTTVVNPSKAGEVLEPEAIRQSAADEPALEFKDLVPQEPVPWEQEAQEAAKPSTKDLAAAFKDEPLTFEDPDPATSTALEDLTPQFESFREDYEEEEPEEDYESTDYMQVLSDALQQVWLLLRKTWHRIRPFLLRLWRLAGHLLLGLGRGLLALFARLRMPRRLLVALLIIAALAIALVIAFPFAAGFVTSTIENFQAQQTQNAAAALVTPSPTPEPTSTPVPTPTTTPMPLVLGCVEVLELRVRAGPATTFNQVGGLRFEECYEFDAISIDAEWVRLREFEGTSDYGWVAIEFLEVIGDLGRLPLGE